MGLKTAGEKLCFKGGLFGGGVHVALHAGDPAAANELAGGGYARAAVAAASWRVDPATGRASNAAGIAFPEPGSAWRAPTHVGLWDAAAGGALLASGALSGAAPAPRPGAAARFAAGALTFDLKTDGETDGETD